MLLELEQLVPQHCAHRLVQNNPAFLQEHLPSHPFTHELEAKELGLARDSFSAPSSPSSLVVVGFLSRSVFFHIHAGSASSKQHWLVANYLIYMVLISGSLFFEDGKPQAVYCHALLATIEDSYEVFTNFCNLLLCRIALIKNS